MDFLKKYLLSTAMRFSPPDEGGGTPEDERIPEPDLDDDETVTDPVGETDEGDDEGDDGGDEQDEAAAAGGAEPPARQSRGDRQFAELRRQARERAEENARLTREMAELRGQLTATRQPQQVAETPQQRAERLALMSPEERADVIVSERLAAHEARQAQLTNQLLDQSDRATFEASAAANPLLKKLAPEVERKRQELYQRDGQLVPRATIATFLIGERVLAQQGKGKPAAQQRRRSQETRPSNGRGDVAPNRSQRRSSGDPVADMEARFGDIQI